MTKFQAPKGVSEYVPPRSNAFAWVRSTLENTISAAGYQLLELPIFEDTELFTRIGASTDVVSKEMYTFEDRGGRSITLRPEGTVGALRAVSEHGLDRGSLPAKVYYCGPFFRAERPQKGRYRQFYSIGIEAIGTHDAALDAEIIAIADAGFKKLGLTKYRLEMTSLGDAESRAAHRVDLVKFISALDLDEETKERAKLNPLRLFDDKRDEVRTLMAKAPILLDYLSPESKANFAQVQRYLTAMEIAFTINPRMVRGLDYYTGTTFEFVHDLLGAQSGIGGGGRYDGLMGEIGGQDITGIGFGLGLDRALLAVEAEGVVIPQTFVSDLFIIPMGEAAKSASLKYAADLRASGFKVELAFGDRALKTAMKTADKSGARYSLVIGDEEIASGVAEVKEMSSGTETSVRLDTLASALMN
jgi:histidyl-tRNA synthetase